MLIVKFLRKLFKALNSDKDPREIGLGLVIGMAMGLTPDSLPITLFLVFLLFVFRANLAVFLLGWGVFKLLGIAAVDHVSNGIGLLLLDKATSLAGFWQWLTHLPVLCFASLNNTLVLGGLVLSVVLAVPVFVLTVRAVKSYRARVSEGKQVWIQKAFGRYRILRAVRWLLVG